MDLGKFIFLSSIYKYCHKFVYAIKMALAIVDAVLLLTVILMSMNECYLSLSCICVIVLLIVVFYVILVQFVVSNRHCLCCCVADWCYGQMYLTISFVFCMKFCFDLMCCSNEKPV